MDELVAAGYEAYNVSASNYDALEKSLQTDFEHLGMYPNGSFIVVIHSGDYTTDSNNIEAATASVDPSMPELDDGKFYYTYNNQTYTMRYLTVTSATDSTLVNNGSVYLLQNETITSASLSILENVLNTGIYCLIDGVMHMPVSTVGGALGISIVDFPEVHNAIFYVDVVAKWTRTYTQIKDEDYGTWSSFSSVDYVTTHLQYRGSYYNSEIQDYESYYQQYYFYEYSNHYMDYSWRKQQAAIAYELNSRNHEHVGDVKVYKDPLNSNTELVLTLYQLRLG